MTPTTANPKPNAVDPRSYFADDDNCCPVFDPTPWDGTTHVWKDRLFFRRDVRQVMHVPIGMGRVITHMLREINDAGAIPDAKDWLMLAYDPSPWKSELLMSVTKEVPGGSMVRLTGTFFTKVYDGPYREVPHWIAATDALLASRNQKAIKYYFHYAYCPKCSKKYGHNYCVAFAQVA
ncbi:MAG: hydrolase [Gemmatimonadaceae bacterium]